MEYAITILWQVVVMFILAAVGYILFKTKKISQEGSKAIGNILIFVSLPCVIVNGFLIERTKEKLIGLLISAAAAAVILFLSMLISRLILGKRSAVENFAASFSNPGFFGIPLIVASLSQDAVFFVAAFVAFLNILQWTYGVSLLEKEAGKAEKISAKSILLKLVKAPFMIAILVGLFLFLTKIPVPSICTKCLNFLASLNTPLAMFTIGIYLAQTNMLKMFVKPRLYLVSAVRLLIIPLVSLGLLSLLPASLMDLKMAVLIASACPVGSNVAVYAQLHHADQSYAVETVIISTLLSIITIPLIVMLAGFIW